MALTPLNRLLASSGEAVYKVMAPDITCPYANSTSTPEVHPHMDGWMYVCVMSVYIYVMHVKYFIYVRML